MYLLLIIRSKIVFGVENTLHNELFIINLLILYYENHYQKYRAFKMIKNFSNVSSILLKS